MRLQKVSNSYICLIFILIRLDGFLIRCDKVHLRIDTMARAITVHKQVLYAAVESRVEILNLHRTVMKVLLFSESEGHPITIDSAGNSLVLTTDHATLKLWDISRREP